MSPLPVYPPALKLGDKIGVMSTSSWVDEKDIITSKAFMEAQGYEVYVHPQATARLNQSAGSAEQKAHAFNELIAAPDIKLIIGARGGNRAATMLDKIDFNAIKSNPKIIMGYSDFTFMLNAVHKQTGLVTFHGPLFRELPTHPDLDSITNVILGQNSSIDLSSCITLKAGDAQGVLLGGNLSVMQSLIGTPYMPDTKGAILVLEDVADHISRYDRMLCQFKNAGILQQLSAIITGSFTNTKDSETNPFGFTLEDILLEHTQGMSYPILMNAPFGHEKNPFALPIGAECVLKNKQLSFKPLV